MPPPTCYYFKILQTYSFAPIFAYSLTMDYRIVHGLTLPPPPGLPPFSNSHSRSPRSFFSSRRAVYWLQASSIKLLDKLKSVKLNTPEIRLNKPHVVSAVISCHLPGYLTGCQIPGYLSIKPGYWKIPGYFSSNTRVFSSTPVIWRCTGICIETISLESPVCMSQLFLMHIHL